MTPTTSNETLSAIRAERRARWIDGVILVLMLAGLATCAAIIAIGSIGYAMDTQPPFTVESDQ
jgi:hypothetical protein